MFEVDELATSALRFRPLGITQARKRRVESILHLLQSLFARYQVSQLEFLITTFHIKVAVDHKCILMKRSKFRDDCCKINTMSC